MNNMYIVILYCHIDSRTFLTSGCKTSWLMKINLVYHHIMVIVTDVIVSQGLSVVQEASHPTWKEKYIPCIDSYIHSIRGNKMG